MSEVKEVVVTRPYRETDKNFVLSTALRGLYYGEPWYQQIPKDIFMTKYHAYLERLIARKDTYIRVACLQDEPDVILGYAIFGEAEDMVKLHYVFVKSPFRRIGIARSLLPINISSVTHLTRVGASLLRKLPGVIFNPFD